MTIPFKPMKNPFYIILPTLFIFVCVFPEHLRSDSCSLTDPFNTNPNNFCPSHPPGLRSDSFNLGTSRPYRQLPTVSSPSGKILIQPKGFWTGIKTTGSSRVLTESNGNTYQISK